MYCPNCGTKTAEDQHFCRACGLGLEKIALSLSEQRPARVDESLVARKTQLEKLGVAALSVFGLGFVAFLSYIIAQKLIGKGNLFAILVLIGFLIMTLCGIASVVLFAKAKELGEATKRRPQPELIKEPETTRELLAEGHFEPIPTVTERTTELLVEKREHS
jgi:hypothetical protein